jgi:hypothetical protein
MKLQKQPLYIRLLIAGGLLLATMPLLFKEYIPMPDFARGFLEGLGLGMEIIGLVFIKRTQKMGMVCND